MAEQKLARLIDAMSATIASHAVQLDALDAAIGDGDHGTNLGRAMTALAACSGDLAGLPLAEALRRIGDLVAAEAGGDGGRYYGALCRGMADAAASGAVAPEGLAAMLDGGIAAVRAAGGAAKGDKTLLDVLIPVAQGVRSQIDSGRPEGIGARIVAAAAHGLHGTTHLQAKHGLAADLGPASVNRIDPGACSCALLLGAAVGALEAGPEPA